MKRELALLSVPVVALAGLGLYLNSRPPQQRDDEGPPRVVVKSFKLVPVTPREAYFGYDTKAEAEISFAGRAETPPNWKYAGGNLRGSGTLVWNDGQERLKPTLIYDESRFAAQTTTSIKPEGNTTKTLFLMRMRELSPTSAVNLRAEFGGSRYYNVQTAAGIRGDELELQKHHATLEVRPRGASTTMPEVSRQRPFELDEVKVTRLNYSNQAQLSEDRSITIHLRPTQNLQSSNIYPYWFTDRTGKRHTTNARKQNLTNVGYGGTEVNTGRRRLIFRFKNADLPGPAPHTFHALISYDDCWPLELKVPIPKNPPPEFPDLAS